MVKGLILELKKEANKNQAKILSGFFKTGKGQYGEGDVFWGIKVPTIRAIARKFIEMSIKEVQLLLDCDIHEVRFAGLTILIRKYEKGDEKEKKKIFNLYLKNIKKNINNWDLVDLSCPQIIGSFLFNQDRDILYKLARSNNLWEKRVAMISTFYFIKRNDFKDSLSLAKILLNDKHDLINKAVGWMLREIGKRNIDIEKDFLFLYYNTMPRTTLRYAIEKMNEEERKFFLSK
ncbi:MAG: DNA alkylation repair protein [Candidatus Paceibacterota bacterium]|jgi:3-methyladenine DNA glycosylase AlkD|nr:DNA alkylation repair protein [bacterium]